jgi:hypothetical protein
MSVCAPLSLSAASRVTVPFRIVNTSLHCANAPVDVVVRVVPVGGAAPSAIEFPLGTGAGAIPTNPFRLPPHASELGAVALTYPPGTTGTSGLRFEVEAPGYAIVTRPFSVTFLSRFVVTGSTGNDAAAAGVERDLSWDLANPGDDTRTIQYAIRVLQTSSSTNPLADRFPEARCGNPVPPGNSANTNPDAPDFLVTGQAIVPGHGSATVCIRTASYATCLEGASCLYRMTCAESLSGETGDSNQNLTAIEAGFDPDGGLPIFSPPIPVAGSAALVLFALLLALTGVRLARRAV